MSCEDFDYSATGRRGIGVIQPQSGLDYPFIAPSADVQFLFADFFLSYDDPADYDSGEVPYTLPFRISWLSGFGCEDSSAASEHEADLIVVDATDRVVFDSTNVATLTARDWGSDYRIYEWQTDDSDLTAVCRCVVYKTWPEDLEPEARNYPYMFEPESAVLDSRTIQRLPKRVLAISVKSGETVLGTVRQRATLALLAGYNVKLQDATISKAPFRDTEVEFAVIPGSGFGKYSTCEESLTPAITAINGANANQFGHLLLTDKDCGYVRVPTVRSEGGGIAPAAESGAALLEIGDDCPPCCDCPDYVNTAAYMHRLWKRYKKIGARAHETKVIYDQNIERWLARYDCRQQHPFRVLLVPQYCPIVDVVLLVCNPFEYCMRYVNIVAAFTSTAGMSAEIMCGHTEIRAPNVNPGSPVTIHGNYPTYNVDFPPIPQGGSAYVKFRLKMQPSVFSDTLTLTMTGTQGLDNRPVLIDGTSTPASATTSTRLNCGLFGENAQPC